MQSRDQWQRAHDRLAGAGYGAHVVVGWERGGRACMALAGAAAASALADLVSKAAFRAGPTRAMQLGLAAGPVAEHARDPAELHGWMGIVEHVLEAAPVVLPDVLENGKPLMATRGPAALSRWVEAGLRMAGPDATRRGAYFALNDPEARTIMARLMGATSYPEMERQLGLQLLTLFGVRPALRENVPEPHRHGRSSFGQGVVHFPPSYPGDAREAKLAYQAAAAHIGAHLRHGGPTIAADGVKPVRLALVALVEDARVEALAMVEAPGLAQLWGPFHTAKPGTTRSAGALFARLARTLFDPGYQDPDSWIAKGRALFDELRHDLAAPTISERIGTRLATDLGQMRVRFDGKSYRPDPVYRDDNMGLWTFEQGAPLTDADACDGRNLWSDVGQGESSQGETARLNDGKPNAVEVAPSTRYPEYDAVAGVERPDWATLREIPAHPGNPARVRDVIHRRASDFGRLRAAISGVAVGVPKRRRPSEEGTEPDIDAAISAMIDLRTRRMPDPKIFRSRRAGGRDVSVLVLIDLSRSTADLIAPGGLTVLQAACEATVMLSVVLEELGDPFAIAGFASAGREHVYYTRVKEFDVPFAAEAQARLAGLRSGLSTRMGAALRHAGASLVRRVSERKMVLLLTDGEPSDIDCADSAYLDGDATAAVRALRKAGIDTVCLAIGDATAERLSRIFGRNAVLRCVDPGDLPRRLPQIYARL